MLQRRTNRTKLLALALASLALVGQLASFAHLVAVEHVSCEHGELVELGRPQRPVAVERARRTEVAVRAASVADSHGHDHCPLGPMRRERLVANTQRPTTLTIPARRSGVVAAGAIAVVAPIAILDLAPKNSPPLV